MSIAATRAPSSATVSINGKPVFVEWTASAGRALAERPEPLVVELELYFSCLVKKVVHFHDNARGRATVSANDKLQLFFRAVTSTACTMEEAERLGRQPETELQTPAVHKLAPKRVRLDHVQGRWQADYSL